MKYLYLLIAGGAVSITHFYLVWRHRDNRRYSISEHAMLTKSSHALYFLSHVVCDIFFLLFSYQFFLVEHGLRLPFYLNIAFAMLDFTQATLPSRGKTEKTHFAAAYISWCCFLLAGIIALFRLPISQPYLTFAVISITAVLAIFVYMHIHRSKLYPHQLAAVPLFVLYMLLVAIGAS